MFNTNEALEKALLHFPRWMDIRKRAKKSSGGLFLDAIIQELDSIQDAIVDYKKDFFIINYIGREESVIDYLYVAQIGEIGNRELRLLSPAMEITTSLKTFYAATEPVAYYQDGNLAFKEKTEAVRYLLGRFEYGATAKKEHVWNVFDEFALFAGLKRYENETNKQLMNRSLLTFRNTTNSTEAGLKNAIINAVSNMAKVSQDEIHIEKPSFANLFKEDESGQIIDRLANINKDIYRTKEWDISRWEHPFKEMEFVASQWDASIENIQDGVGHNEALKAQLTSEIADGSSTDVTIYGYKKSTIEINKYIRQHRLEADINLSLKKYGNVLKPRNVEYKITATETQDITINNTFIDCHRLVDGETEYFIENLLLNPNDVTGITIERGQINPNINYRLRFFPKADFASMQIPKCAIRENGIERNLLTEKGAFRFTTDGILHNTNVKLHASSTRDLMSFSNIVNVKSGFTLADATKDGLAKIDLKNMNSQHIRIEHSCRETSIMMDPVLITPENFVLNNVGEFECTKAEGTLTIDVVANQLFYEIVEGNCIVTTTIEGRTTTRLYYEPGSEQIRTRDGSARPIKVVITKLINTPIVRVRNIRYAHYDVEMTLENGQFLHTSHGTVLPAIVENKLNIKVKTYTGFSPVVHFVHIGASLRNAVYETDVFSSNALAFLDIDSNCIVHLQELNSSGQVVRTNQNYTTKALYRNTTDNAVYLRIDTSNFMNIRRTTPVVERFSFQGQISSFIKLNPGEELDTIIIEGSMLILLSRVSLNSILTPFDKIYVSSKLKGFIVTIGQIGTSSYEERLVTVTRDMIHKTADVYQIRNVPTGIRGAFVIDNIKNIESVGNTINHSFQAFYMIPDNTQEHIAYNRVNMLRPEVDDIQIVNVFVPILPQNRLMIYTIDNIISPDIKADVFFKKSGPRAAWSLGNKLIGVKIIFDSLSSQNYQVEVHNIKKKFILSNTIDLEQEFSLNDTIIDLAEYILIPPDDMRVIFETKTTLWENIVVEEDGFNKLRFSNVSFVTLNYLNNTPVPASEFQLLKEEGIIAWKNDALIGQEFKIQYRYSIPRHLAFKDVERLYELVGYNTSAFRHLFTLKYEGITQDTPLRDEDRILLDDAHKVILATSNPNFRARIENYRVILNKIGDDNKIAVKAGFFYQDGVEIYHFINSNESMLEKLSNIDLINTKRLSTSVLFFQKSTNLLPESNMRNRRLTELSYADFVNNQNIDGISSLSAMTACEQFNLWNVFEMDVSFINGLNSLGTSFNSLSTDGYALLDISIYLKEDSIISLYTKDDIDVTIGREEKYNNNSYSKSIFVRPYKEMQNIQEFSYFVFDKDSYDSDFRYYLLVRGSGLVDDIIIKDYVVGENIPDIHRKNISALGLDIHEHVGENFVQRFMFDPAGNRLERLDVSNEGLIKTGSNVDWGLTKVQELKNDWRQCILREVDLIKDTFLQTTTIKGTVETPGYPVRNRESIRNMIIKVNEVLTTATQGFTIQLLGSSTIGGLYTAIATAENANILTVPQNRLTNYVKVRVEMPPQKVINNIEIYSEYVETNTPLRIGEHHNGQLTTKIYDAGFNEHFLVKRLVADNIKNPSNIEMAVRAFRQKQNRIVWTDWKPVQLNGNLEVTNTVEFDQYRYFQFRLLLKSANAQLRVSSIELEVIK